MDAPSKLTNVLSRAFPAALEVTHQRQAFLDRIFDGKPPRLWCPPLTHYTADRSLDKERMRAHWQSLRRHSRAFLIPGTAGDGWELDDSETDAVIDFALEFAREHDAYLLIGVLKKTGREMREAIERLVLRLREQSESCDAWETLRRNRICGLAVCPPTGAELSREQIRAGLETVLDLNLPTAIYQLPQVTGNEVAPSVVADWARRYPHFLYFKDTSGRDLAAREVAPMESGLIFLRGAVGDYARWQTESGGPYHGVLDGFANCFGARLAAVFSLLEERKLKEAQEASDQLSRLVLRVLSLAETFAKEFPAGNPFTNANKAVDHFMAYGCKGWELPAPMLHAGVRLPDTFIHQAGEALKSSGAIPETGYLHTENTNAL